MEERIGEASAGTEQLTVMSRQLHAGDLAPDFRLDYLDLADMIVSTISLANLRGLVRLLSVVNSLQHPVCQRVTRRWEALSERASLVFKLTRSAGRGCTSTQSKCQTKGLPG